MSFWLLLLLFFGFVILVDLFRCLFYFHSFCVCLECCYFAAHAPVLEFIDFFIFFSGFFYYCFLFHCFVDIVLCLFLYVYFFFFSIPCWIQCASQKTHCNHTCTHTCIQIHLFVQHIAPFTEFSFVVYMPLKMHS